MMLRVSVVVPARDAAATLGACLRALAAQNMPRDEFEIMVVVDQRSRDDTAAIAEGAGVVTVSSDQKRGEVRNAGGARNAGIAAAQAPWVAFTDADCIPSRNWLRSLLAAVGDESDPKMLGAAGQTLGYESATSAARYVDLTGGLRADRHLEHKRYPWAPDCNVVYRRSSLNAVGGFDTRFESYEGADLHTRLIRQVGGTFVYAERAVVHHRHRAGWRAYWRQQVSYGGGFAQFFLCYEDELHWTARNEARAWLDLAGTGFRALMAGSGDAALIRRGTFVKSLAQRVGFVTTYWRPGAARRWKNGRQIFIETAV